MGRASALNESSQDVGIASCRIEQPIGAVIQDQSSDGAAYRSRASPATFRRGRRGLGQRRHVALAIPAATGDGSEPAIEAVGQAATGYETAHEDDGQKVSKIVRPGRAHSCHPNNAQAVPCDTA